MIRRASVAGLRGLTKRVAELGAQVRADEQRKKGLEERALAHRIIADAEALEGSLEWFDWMADKLGVDREEAPSQPSRARRHPRHEEWPMARWMDEDPRGVQIFERYRGAFERVGIVGPVL